MEYSNESVAQIATTIQAENMTVDESYQTEVPSSIWDKMKALINRFTIKKIDDGSKENKKQGFFSKLFGKKEEAKKEVNEENNKEEKVIKDGLSHVVLDNKDGKYDIRTSGNNKSQDDVKVSSIQEEYSELR